MVAMEYRGPYRVLPVQKPDPVIEHPGDAVVQVLRSCICGSDLHLYHGLVPDTRIGSTFGHEFVGRVVDTGTSVGGLYGYSHTTGGYDGGQAQFVRVPMADVGPTKIPAEMDLDDAVLLT